ncbi:MAG: hypothetical protein ICV64_04015 [Thermoleophilia bacterium]|nr:hypothetical protein [Thermoleophilia bacterium]
MPLLALLLAVAPGWHGDRPPPPAAFAPARFAPLPTRAVALCARMPARALCPARLPRPFLGRRPPFRAEVLRAGSSATGLEFAYSAAVEPPVRGWRRHTWWNRPCCSLHFTVEWVRGPAGVPRGARPAVVGGSRGRFLPARGFAFRDDGMRGRFWPNHAWFFWRDRGVAYAASLHVFGRGGETRRLLGRVLRELRPARAVGYRRAAAPTRPRPRTRPGRGT